MYSPVISLYDQNGQRKYLNQFERLSFFECTKSRPVHKKLFCQLLYFTGARIAEIHNLTTQNIDFSNQTVVIETLKRRRNGIFREIPLPNLLLEILNSYINNIDCNQGEFLSLWKFSLRSASRYVKDVMVEAGITGVRASSRGLRHGFAVHSINIAPITLVKKWLGHSSLETTAIYLNVVGTEEREIAKRVWSHKNKESTDAFELQTIP